MRIGELSKATALPVETIRYYETQGLVDCPARLENNYRAYGPRHLSQLLFVSHCRKLGMGLAEIREILAWDGSNPQEAEHIHEVLHHQIEAVDRQIRDLQALKKKLLALECSCHGHIAGRQCGIITELQHPADEEH